jgi:hypothetical protein
MSRRGVAEARAGRPRTARAVPPPGSGGMARPRLGRRAGRSLPVRFGAVVRKRGSRNVRPLGGERARSKAPGGISRPYRARLKGSAATRALLDLDPEHALQAPCPFQRNVLRRRLLGEPILRSRSLGRWASSIAFQRSVSAVPPTVKRLTVKFGRSPNEWR